MSVKSLLLCGAVSCSAALLPAAAQSQVQGQVQADSDVNKADPMQRQMDQLQQQIKTLKTEMAAAAKKRPADADVWQNAYGADVPVGKRLVKAVPFMERVHITVGGFFASESVWRQRNETADIGSSFTGEPFPFAPTYNEHEFRGSARQSRLSLLAEGNIDPKQKSPVISSRIFSASARLPTTIKATAGRRACGNSISIMTTATQASICSPARPGA
jgi:hypothetical protein